MDTTISEATFLNIVLTLGNEIERLSVRNADLERTSAIDRKDAIEAVANADKWQDKFETAMDQLKDAGIEFDAELSPDNA